MNRTEQKQLLSDIISNIKELKIELKQSEPQILEAYNKINELDNIIGNIGDVDAWDVDELKTNISSAVIENSNVEGVNELIQEFNSELEEHMSELSDTRKEALEDKYMEMAIVEDIMTTLNESEEISDVYDKLDEVIDYLLEMKK